MKCKYKLIYTSLYCNSHGSDYKFSNIRTLSNNPGSFSTNIPKNIKSSSWDLSYSRRNSSDNCGLLIKGRSIDF